MTYQFQFHKGTIRTFNGVSFQNKIPNFNSIKVRLERVSEPGLPIDLRNFNSIKVRLELAYAIGLLLAFLFQFHKGTIRTNCILPVTVLGVDFNSIKVRLEHTSASCCTPMTQFQFHKGTIRTGRG